MPESPISAAARRTVAEDRIVDMLLLRGWPVELRGHGRATASAQAYAALERLVVLGLPWAPGPSGRCFDLAEAANFVVWAGSALGDPTFADRYVASARRLVGEGASGERRYAVTLRRTFHLDGYRAGRRMRLRLPVPVEDAALGDLDIALLPPDGIDFEISTDAGRIDLIVAAPEAGTVTAGFRARFSACAVPTMAVLDQTERELYTRAAEGLVHTTERIARLARDLAKGTSGREAALERLWTFCLTHLAFGYVHYDRLNQADPLGTVLDQGWSDCRLGSALLVALCRARGMPARLVSGYLLYPSSPIYHTWLEVWLDGKGWYPLDLFGWGLSLERDRPGIWRDRFRGRLDHRMVLERPPLLFAGTGSLRLPAAWDMLAYAEGRGSVMEFREAGTDRIIYTEYIEIEMLSDPG